MITSNQSNSEWETLLNTKSNSLKNLNKFINIRNSIVINSEQNNNEIEDKKENTKECFDKKINKHKNEYYIQTLTKKSTSKRLYDNSKTIQSKIEKIRKNNELIRKQSSSPQITKTAKKIIRDPQLFGERLYPFKKIQKLSNNFSRNTKINSSELKKIDSFFEDNELEKLYGDLSFMNIYRNDKEKKEIKYDHKPKLNSNSLKIAEKWNQQKKD